MSGSRSALSEANDGRRSQIDEIDKRLARLLLERFRIAAGIVADRLLVGGDLTDEGRERVVLDRFQAGGPRETARAMLTETKRTGLRLSGVMPGARGDHGDEQLDPRASRQMDL